MDVARSVRLQGVLEKRGKFTGALNTRKYQCMLQDVRFIYHKDGAKAKTLDIFQFQSIRPVRECSFEIVTKSTMHVFNASSAAERDNWVSAMQELMLLRSTRHSLPNIKSLSLQSTSPSEDKTIYEMVEDNPKLNSLEKMRTVNRSFDFSSVGHDSIPFSSPTYCSVKTTVESDCKKEKTFRPLPAAYEEIEIQDDILKTKNPPSLYEEAGFVMIDDADCSNGDRLDQFSKDESNNGTDLYAYATADDIRKVFIQDKPNLCNEYSSVHDSRNSAFLYSEVAMGNDKDESDSKGSESVSSDRTKNLFELRRKHNEIGIYHFGREPEEEIYSTVANLERERHCGVNDCFQEAVDILESGEPVLSDDSTVCLSKYVQENRTSSSQCNRTATDCSRTSGSCKCGSTTYTNKSPMFSSYSCVLYSDVKNSKELQCKSMTTNINVPKSTRINLPVIRSKCLNVSHLEENSGNSVNHDNNTSLHQCSTSDHQPLHSVIDELRAFIGPTASSKENETVSGKAAPEETSAISELRQFLNRRK